MSDCSASIFSQILSGDALVCSKTLQNYETSSSQKSVQAVADATVANQGADSVAAQVTEQFAATQEALAPNDTSNVTSAIVASSAGKVFGASCNGEPGLDLSLVGGPCLTYTLLKEIGLGILLALAVGTFLYGAAVLGPFIPKGRR